MISFLGKLKKIYINEDHIKTVDSHKEDPVKYIKTLFLQSIRDRLPQNTIIASSLSGGIDSSSIVCAIRHENPDTEIHTYSRFILESHVMNLHS